MRLKKSIANINTDKVKAFYDQRAKSYSGGSIDNVTMLQDKNPALSEKRTHAEFAKLLPKLRLDSNSCVLDLACGAGRWLEALPINISKYRGIDFSDGLIEIARSRNTRPNAEFFTGSILEADTILANDKGSFNRVLMMGLFPCLNDSDTLSVLSTIPSLMVNTDVGGGVICIRASIGIDERLTLKDFYSEELQSDYEAIYRTRDEYMEMFARTLFPAGFAVTDQGLMYDDSLNNRKETTQYYFIIER